jgi:hypothetical protein
MTSEMKMKLKPWLSPNYAQVEMPPRPRQDGPKEPPSLHVSELSAEALDGLAEQWLADLYTKAGKPNRWSTNEPKP